MASQDGGTAMVGNGREETAGGPTAADPVIIVREHGLQEELTDVVRRIRLDPATARSRILIIAREEDAAEADGGEAGPEPGATVVLEPTPARGHRLAGQPETLEWRAAGESLVRLGREFLRISQSMDLLIDEGQRLVKELRVAPYQGSRADLKRVIGRTQELMEWIEATNREMVYVAGKASEGMERTRSADVLRDAARAASARFPGVRFVFEHRDPDTRLYLNPFLAYLAFAQALEILAERIGANGEIRIRVDRKKLHLEHSLMGVPADGRIVDDLGPGPVSRLRHFVCERHGGRILPGPTGRDGTSLVIALPLREFEAEVREER